MSRRRWWAALALLLLLLTALWTVTPAQAQARSLYWRRWDVSIDSVNTRENRFAVAEVHDIQFTSGQFRFGFRAIPLDRVEDLTNFRVWEGETELVRNCSEQPGTFCVTQTGGEAQIVYYFLRPAQDERRVFTIEYEVVGGLRSYEGGDQLDWFAVAPDHSFPIESATVTVRMPEGFAPREGVDPVVSYGAPTTVTVQGDVVTYTATRRISASEGLEIRIQYPHDPNMRVASWQQAFDRQAVYENNVRPVLNLFFGAAGLLLLVLGPLGVYYLWHSRGRDPEAGVLPDYLSEPPSDLPPAIAGTLVDETADLQDVMATVLDLARRGYLVIEEDRNPGLFGIGASTTFTFKRTDKPDDDLRGFERTLLRKIFRGKDERTLDSLRNRFYTAIPQIQGELYREVVREGFFSASPDNVRRMWSGIGVVLMVLAVLLGVLALMAVDQFAESLVCVPLALGVVSIALLIAAGRMPAKTAKGAEEAAKWRAFREYLRNIRRYTDLEQATELFNDYLPYAVAFGLERTWVNHFSQVPATPIPYWYYPVYLGGPWRRGYHRGERMIDMRNPDIRSQLARPGFSLDNMAQGISGGLNQMSSGLFGMLNSAATTFTSRPASTGSSGSWSGGGGGWSGGFSGGGGGGGGGSAGFG